MTDTVLGRAYRALLVMYPRAFRKRFADALVLAALSQLDARLLALMGGIRLSPAATVAR